MPLENSESKTPSIKELINQFSMGSSRQRRRLIPLVEERSDELCKLGTSLLDDFDSESDNWSVGWILQVCNRKQPEFLQQLLASKPNGWFTTPSKTTTDFSKLQKALLEERFEDADRNTSSILRELAGSDATKRGYVYFSEVALIPAIDLETIDRLWVAYSQGKFGFSVQGRILDSLNGRYEQLWPRIGWKVEGVWTRYPNSFTWSIEAPEGHMPLVNQLRGVRLMDALLNHQGLNARRNSKK